MTEDQGQTTSTLSGDQQAVIASRAIIIAYFAHALQELAIGATSSEEFRQGYEAGLNAAKITLERTLATGRKEQMFEEQVQKDVQVYINNFRNEIGYYMEDNVGRQISVAGSPGGIVLNVYHERYIPNADNFVGVFPTLAEALDALGVKDYQASNLLVKAVQENTAPSPGTSIFYSDTIFLIKGKADGVWSKEEAKSNVEKIYKYMEGLASELANENKSSSPTSSQKPGT